MTRIFFLKAITSLLGFLIQYHRVSAYAPPNSFERREFVGGILSGAAVSSSLLIPTGADDSVAAWPTSSSLSDPFDALHHSQSKDVYDDILSTFEAKTIPWESSKANDNHGTTDSFLDWNNVRYRSSTLSTTADKFAPVSSDPTLYPEWMEGYWKMQYKFKGASFPQGRSILSLRTAGAGLGTCLSLPNVGYNPPAPHALHFMKTRNDLRSTSDSKTLNIHEDLAYNIPRKFEAFWPQSKVLAVQTGSQSLITPKCFVTGQGCSSQDNPDLRLPSSRFTIDFDAPTRRSGRLAQSSDVTMVATKYGSNDKAYAASKSFSQFNINQELQTYYREFLSLEKIEQLSSNKRAQEDDDASATAVIGKLRVAAFLPKFIRALDDNKNAGSDEDYDEGSAVAIYDYKIFMNRIDESEASLL